MIEVRNERELQDCLTAYAFAEDENLEPSIREQFDDVLELIKTRQPYVRRLRLALQAVR